MLENQSNKRIKYLKKDNENDRSSNSEDKSKEKSDKYEYLNIRRVRSNYLFYFVWTLYD